VKDAVQFGREFLMFWKKTTTSIFREEDATRKEGSYSLKLW
jgi:hypothetical protein